ncbi:uncharacterized protein ASCRUDRAFT_8984 [Ascoidea rubescens DSM 1968]|uniref:Protein kinase domain-containing protein n=1 Tax=Ascoidea rubescens DSM 1968 TaxID=1344418 RepID=A0A1D2VEY4_9ASCO|nr:hypothetical protein ASCRUDRAFT_8984 [Ascoidea rubescens DSM 1968]ODV60234.1 hypothetical protein ASCRUDRAFT_8984 [Ascoidea rubescens DSM 1968]
MIIVGMGLKYFEGENLNRMNKHVLDQIEKDVNYLHKNSFFHGDLNPDNILINDKDQIKIIDFGGGVSPQYNPDRMDGKKPDWICLKLIKKEFASSENLPE